jgi:adenylate kinase family enzyme
MGSSCSGKTTVAGVLAGRLAVPHVELDALHHGPNWLEATADELRAKVDAALAGHDGWVVDGNYLAKLGTSVIDRADTIVWLDLPLRTLLRRLWGRTVGRIRDGVELWSSGNRESWRSFLASWDGLLWYTVRHHYRRRRDWPREFAGRRVVRLRTPREVAAWLASPLSYAAPAALSPPQP